jgi:hypothetical protein
MRGGARGGLTPYMPPRETLTTTSSRSNSEALVVHMVLTHLHTAFYPYMCGLRKDVVVVAAALIGYDDVDVAVGTTTRRRLL